MKNIFSKFNKKTINFSVFITLALFLTSCADNRGGVAVDASGEQGGGTQPGGGGLGFAILFLVVAVTVLGLFAMDRIRKSKESQNTDSQDSE